MAEYTIELKDVVAAGHKIFDFRYPFYDESKRAEFEEKFIRHFYFREIGVPTVDRFKFNLQDKMNTVFPYYNELFNAAAIEYDVLDNYKLTETITIERENEGKTSGVSSTVGQLFGNQATENKQNRVVDSQGNVDTIGKDTDKETSVTDTNATGNSVTNSNGTTKTDTENETTVNGTSEKATTLTESGEKSTSESGEKTTTETGTNSQEVVKKFLDTPQGLTDLTNSKYLTTLNQDNVSGNDSKEGTERDSREGTEQDSRTTNGTESATDTQTTNATGLSETTNTNNSETDTTDNSKSETERNLERNTLVNQDSTNKETTNDTVTGTVTDEQKTTQDNNTRTYMDSKQTETQTTTRRGNIGVDTDSDAITKHIRLQKTLKSIELLFFNECEDLFMLVY